MNKLTKASLLTIILTSSIFAQEENHRAEMMGKVKSQMMTMADKEIRIATEFKSCVNGAQDKESIKSCNATRKDRMEALRAEGKQFREGMKEQRMHKNRE